jgi:hypothetical protein
LKIKRRNVSRTSGPTESFLASVAAADLAIPSIEFPDSEDCEMGGDAGPLNLNVGFLSPRRGASPPRTPMPGLSDESHGDGHRRTDWYASTPGSPDSLTRPSSPSDPSNWSDDSYFSGDNTMRSNGTICTSPESEVGESLFYARLRKGKHAKHATVEDDVEIQHPVANLQVRSKKYAEVGWTKDQSDHLLRTYHLYLQDPTVTPFRMDNTSIPPEGIIYRVSKEAKRSWKGLKSKKTSKSDQKKVVQQRTSSLTVESALMDFANSRARSLTPTGDAPMAYIKWPHSGAATRSHLRSLCKNNYDQSAQMYMYLQTRSTTPFTQNRDPDYMHISEDFDMSFTAPGDSTSSFSTKDIALSLATSTLETMQPDGPLARLASGSLRVIPAINIMNETNVRDFAINTSNMIPRRLGSPFSAKTYGPQSSKTFHSGVSKSLNSTSRVPQSHSNTIAARGPLRSPVQFDPSRSLNGTQKRRAQHDLEDELTSNGAVSRPSIMDNEFFGPPIEPAQRRVRSRGHTVGDASLRHRDYAYFAPQSINFVSSQNDVFGPSRHRATQSASHSLSKAKGFPMLGLLPPPVFKLPGRPVPEHSTYPRRVPNPRDDTFSFPGSPRHMATVRRRPYHTTQNAQHQSRHSIESFDFSQRPALPPYSAPLDEQGASVHRIDESGSGAGCGGAL